MKPVTACRFAAASLGALAIFLSLEAFGVFDAAAQELSSADRITVSRSGADHGASVVYIPGLATPGAVYAPLVAQEADWDNHVVTLNGFGGGTEAPVALENVVEGAALDVAAYLEAENLEDVVLVGHSMGAQVALLAAGYAPDQVSEVIVVDSAPFFAGLMQPGVTPEMMAPQAAAIHQQMSAMPRDAYLGMMAQGLRVQSMTEQGQAQVMAWIEQADQRAVAAATAELMGTDFAPRLSAVQAPVTLLYAEFPEMAPSVIRQMFVSQYEGRVDLEARGVADSRHFIMLDQPERFADEIARVVEGE
ncbi:alpha/beta hydrolase [Oceanicaulis alexandrii]|uniref:alpha/beta fold hydrolase n=1 Tax=Oceanicaulis alexandrii TaxID=153233 RepID=UPI0035CEC79E